jgi:hypothetical protein
VTDTCVELTAETVNIDVLPLVTDVGLAEMLTEGAGAGSPGIASRHPVKTTTIDRKDGRITE